MRPRQQTGSMRNQESAKAISEAGVD